MPPPNGTGLFVVPVSSAVVLRAVPREGGGWGTRCRQATQWPDGFEERMLVAWDVRKGKASSR